MRISLMILGIIFFCQHSLVAETSGSILQSREVIQQEYARYSALELIQKINSKLETLELQAHLPREVTRHKNDLSKMVTELKGKLAEQGCLNSETNSPHVKSIRGTDQHR